MPKLVPSSDMPPFIAWVWVSSFSDRLRTTVSILSAVPRNELRIRVSTSMPTVLATSSAMAMASLPNASPGLPTSRLSTTPRNELPALSTSSECRRISSAHWAIAATSTPKPLPAPPLPEPLPITLATTVSARSAIGLASSWASRETASSRISDRITLPAAMMAGVLRPKVADEAANWAWMLISWIRAWPLHTWITRAAALIAVEATPRTSTTMLEYLEIVPQSSASLSADSP